MSELALLPAFTTAGLAAIAAAHGQGLQLKITHLAFGDTAYDVRDGNGVPLAAARARVALETERVRVAVAAGNAVTANSILVVGEVPAAIPEFWIKEVGFFAEDGTLVAVWSMAGQTLGWRGANAPWLFKFVLSWSDLPPNAITVVFDGDATLSALATDMARLDAKVHHTVVTGGGIAWDDLDDTQLTDAITAMITALIAANAPNLAGYLQRNVADILTAGYFTAPVVVAIAAGHAALDVAEGNVFTIAVNADFTLDFPGGMAGKAGMMLVVATQDGTGHTLTLAGGLKLAAGEWSVTPGAVNLLWITSDGSGTALDVVISQRGA